MQTRKTEALTARQARVLEHIRRHTIETGAPPTVREIAAHFGCSSSRAAGQYIEALERKGHLTRLRGLSRNLRLTDPASGLPVLGQVPAGQPLLAIENPLGRLDPLAQLGPGEHYAVRVNGQSMRDAGILDGDTVVVRHAPHIAPGAIGVVYLDGEATVKYVHPTRRGVRLLPANPDFAPLEADGERTEIRIAGPVVAVWRMVKGGKRT